MDAMQIGERLAKLRAQAKAREDGLLIDLVDFLQAVILEPVPEPVPAAVELELEPEASPEELSEVEDSALQEP